MQKKERAFFKIFFDKFPREFTITSLVIALFEQATSDGVLILNPKIRRDIATKGNVQVPTLNNLLVRMAQLQIIARVDSSTYVFNPYMVTFSRGTESQKNAINVDFLFAPIEEKKVEASLPALEVDTEKQPNSTIEKLRSIGLIE